MTRNILITLSWLTLFPSFGSIFKSMKQNDQDRLKVASCRDFIINGKGNHTQWTSVPWVKLQLLDETPNPYLTRFKIMYSPTGIYVLAHCEDGKISTNYQTDQGDVWEGDVFEVFFQTDEADPLYFEYEINPLGTELVLLVPNNKGDFMGWSPWHYEGDRKIMKKVVVDGGQQKSGESIKSWTAEMFFPYALFKGLKQVPPKPGTTWKANFYRMDYDEGKCIKWCWRPIEINFHQYEKFGKLVFE